MGKGFIDVNNLSAYTIDGKKEILKKRSSCYNLWVDKWG
jgi:hypothetical protein